MAIREAMPTEVEAMSRAPTASAARQDGAFNQAGDRSPVHPFAGWVDDGDICESRGIRIQLQPMIKALSRQQRPSHA